VGNVDQDVLFLTEILKKAFEGLRNDITNDMEEGKQMLIELSGKIKEDQHNNQVFSYS
jgi:hypothetical protein